jgi:hypothetical protein
LHAAAEEEEEKNRKVTISDRLFFVGSVERTVVWGSFERRLKCGGFEDAASNSRGCWRLTD